MKQFDVRDAMAPLPGLATDAGIAWRIRGARPRRRGAVLMYANHNKTTRQSIPFDVLKAQEDF
ncbi:MAG: hypothetical protein GY859_13010 [Desulfobacterales bacterium]|nr:hypothetical protein [Desulfobacterales bacterium]